MKNPDSDEIDPSDAIPLSLTKTPSQQKVNKAFKQESSLSNTHIHHDP